MLTGQSQKADYYPPESLVRPSPRTMRAQNGFTASYLAGLAGLEAIVEK